MAPAPAASNEAKKQRKPRFKKIEHDFPVEPRIIQVVKKPKTFVDHSYRDFSTFPVDIKSMPPTSIEEMSFSEKVHDMLSDERFSNWIQWLPHGRAFKITVPKRLEQGRVLQKYFGHNRYSSFLRQLNNHGFKHITKGQDRNSYYHECFLKGMKHILKYMPPGRDARRLMPDPDNEPDFYAISRVCPLPEGKTPVTAQNATQVLPGATPMSSSLQQSVAPLQLQNLVGQSSQLPLDLGLSALQSLQSPQVSSLQSLRNPPAASALQTLQTAQPQHAQASFQHQALQQRAAALQQQQDYASLLTGPVGGVPSGLAQGGFSSGIPPLSNNQGLSSQQQLSDEAALALLLRSRAASGGGSLFGL